MTIHFVSSSQNGIFSFIQTLTKHLQFLPTFVSKVFRTISPEEDILSVASLLFYIFFSSTLRAIKNTPTSTYIPAMQI